MKNSKKMILTLGAAAATVAPIASTIACGSSLSGFQGKYDTNNDGKLKLWSTFSSSGPQTAALEAVVKKYNDTNASTAQDVEIVAISGGYGASSEGLVTKFEANDKKTLPNLVIGYPDSLGTVARYDMHYDLGVNSDLEGKGVSMDIFDETFTNNNDQIAGIEEGGFYTVPFAKSIDMMTYNEPVLKHFLTLLVSAGATVKTGSNLERIFTNTAHDADVAEIAKSYTKSDAADTDSLAGKTYGDEIQTDIMSLLDFAIDVNSVAKMPDDHYTIGIDSITNFMYTYGYSMTNPDGTTPNFDDFFFKKGEDGYIEYTLNDKESNGYKNFKTIYEKMEQAMNDGHIFIRDLGYSSDSSKNHKMAISLGSTAGYSYNFVGSGFDATLAADETKTTKVTGITVENEGMKTNDDGTEYYEYTWSSGSYSNGIRSKEYQGQITNFDYISTFTKDELQAKISANVGNAKNLFKYDARQDDPEDDGSYEAVAAVKGAVALSAAAGNGYGNKLYFIPADSLKDGATTTMQEGEMSIYETPGVYTTGGHKTTLLQGPSIFGVHANEIQNKESRDFMGWLFGEDVTFGEGSDAVSVMPAEWFASEASYILPTNSFLDDSSNGSIGNAAQKLSFNTIASIKQNADHYGFDNPVDYTTSSTREHIKSAIVSSYGLWENTGKAATLDVLYTNLKNLSSVIK